ncbi:MAG: AAA family ATPase [Rhodobacteraceae bacterium]|nr:MAG: AAA family ATPase [Paracoccaceae bacterium]
MKDTVLSPSGQAQDAAEQAVQFLKHLDASGWHNLAAIDPNGGAPISKSFAPGSWAEIAEWVSHWSGQRNLYYTVNEVREGFGNAKPGKSDIANVRALFVDLDPHPAGELEAERARIKSALEGAPVLFGEIVDSGRGYQALAIFTEKRRATDETREWAEQYGRGLCVALGGDAVQNVDRLLRLPGPLNIPTPDKRAKGYVEAKLARVVSHCELRVNVDEIEARVKPIRAEENSGADEAIAQVQIDIEHSGYDLNVEFSDLPAELRDRFEEDLSDRPGLAKIWDGQLKSADRSGSAFRFALAGALQGAGRYSAEDYAQLAYVWPYSVQADGDRDDKLTPRQLSRDWVRAQPTQNVQLDPSEFFYPISEDGATASQGAAEVAKRRRLPMLSFSEAADTAGSASAAPLVKGFLDAGAMSVLYGPSNSGKTFVALDLAFHIAAGRPWGSMDTVQSGVFYVAAEGGHAIRKRIAALRQRYAESPKGFCLCPTAVDLRAERGDVGAIVEAVRSCGEPVGLIVIDTLSRALSGGNENGPEDMGALVKHVDAIREQTGAHVMLVHHSGKDATRGARGHSILRAATDTEIEVDDGVIRTAKQRDMEFGPDLAFNIIGTVIGHDSEGNPMTSATIRLETSNGAATRKPTQTEEAVLDCLTAISASGPVSAQDIASKITRGGRRITHESVRKHLESLAKKGHSVQKTGRKWTAGAQKLEIPNPSDRAGCDNLYAAGAMKLEGRPEDNVFG